MIRVVDLHIPSTPRDIAARRCVQSVRVVGQVAAELNIVHAGAGSNSLHPGEESELSTETVSLSTLDRYCADHEIDRMALVKIDTEGHDLAVLRGATGMLAEERIDVVQFEYNWRWIGARSFLRDAFDLVTPLGYRIGKVTPSAIEFYPGYDWGLETFVEGNYLACRTDLLDLFPHTPWWKN